MVSHREVRKASHVLPMALLVAGLLCRSGYGGTGAGPAGENARAQVSKVLRALPSVALPAAGRGTAIVMWDTAGDKPADRPRFVEFAFKGPLSRSDVFEFGAGKKGPWLYSHAITDQIDFGVNAGGARISYHPQHNQLGEDFHPAVFLSYPEPGEGPLDKRLRQYLDPELDLAAEVDAEGVLQLVHRWSYQYQNSFYGGTDRFSFDTRRGYLPVLIENDSDYYEPPKESWRWVIRFEWVRYGSVWYLGSAERQAYRADIPATAQPWQITITEFDPNAEVSDEEFTMEAVGAQEGMTVVEAGTGFTHLYSPPAATPAGWKETSEETEAASNAPPQESPPAQSTLNLTEEQTPSESAETASPSPIPLSDRTRPSAPPAVVDGTHAGTEDLSHTTASATNARKQPGESAEPVLLPPDQTHAAGAGHLAVHPPRVVRIHTLLGLFLLVGLFLVVEYAHAHTRTGRRQ